MSKGKVFDPNETKEQRKARKRQERLKKLIAEQRRTITPTEDVAFVLGNGNSRRCINPKDLQEHGKIYGCNALYRSFIPDYLIAVDTKMVREIVDTNYHLENTVYTNPNNYSKKIKGLNLFNPSKGWSSGPTALWLASQHNYKTIYILGFDYVGLGEKQDIVNNVYAGTPNYKGINDRATYYGNWTRQTANCINSHPRTKYVRILERDDSFIPDHLRDLPNLTHLNREIFLRNFEIKPISQ